VVVLETSEKDIGSVLKLVLILRILKGLSIFIPLVSVPVATLQVVVAAAVLVVLVLVVLVLELPTVCSVKLG
jgi:hypothetical protein